MRFKQKHRTVLMALVACVWLGVLPPQVSAIPAPPHTAQSVAKSAGFSSGTVMTDGSVYVWGDNQYGQLGDGTYAAHTVPAALQGLTGVKELSFGSSHMLAVKTDGSVWVSGNNVEYELGDGTTKSNSVPAQVTALPSVASAQAGWQHSVAYTVGGAVYEWGSYPGNQTISTPQAVYGFPMGVVQQVAAGGDNGTGDFSLAIVSGAVYAWGSNSVGQLGNGSAGSYSMVPVQVQLPAGKTFVKVTAGSFRAAALASDGTVYEWGQVLHFNDTYSQFPTPVQVTANGFTGIQDVSCGYEHCLALQTNGTVWAWGSNAGNAVGAVASALDFNQPIPLAWLGAVTGIAANNNLSMAVTQSAAVYAWGTNTYGQLGLEAGVNSSVPAPVSFACPPVTGGTSAGGLACLKVNGQYIQLVNGQNQYTLAAPLTINSVEIIATPADINETVGIDNGIVQKPNYYHLDLGTNVLHVSTYPGSQQYQLTVTHQKDPTAQPPTPIYAFSFGFSFLEFVVAGFDKELDQAYVSPNGGLLNDLFIKDSASAGAHPMFAEISGSGKSVMLFPGMALNSPSQIQSVSAVKDAVYSVQSVGSEPFIINVVPADTIGGIVKMIQSNAEISGTGFSPQDVSSVLQLDVSGTGHVSKQDVSVLLQLLPPVVVPASNWIPDLVMPMPE